jgi:hypothetical protein
MKTSRLQLAVWATLLTCSYSVSSAIAGTTPVATSASDSPKTASTAPYRPVALALPSAPPCWYQLPGSSHLVNMSQVASAYVGKTGKAGNATFYLRAIGPEGGYKIASFTIKGSEAPNILYAIRDAVKSCR